MAPVVVQRAIFVYKGEGPEAACAASAPASGRGTGVSQPRRRVVLNDFVEVEASAVSCGDSARAPWAETDACDLEHVMAGGELAAVSLILGSGARHTQ
jgi:hypothetical protein